ncbi:MAG TPA: response regulator [Oligoflexus sp.]|uniref:response regulator n=1 Tax=Oligoflexus sp. TaxID=1971216 RepID=UPI002D348DA9|nr:response regulator [Oligoflexus sp.]HYX35242.1 response regulator [Oligoflexus sp.]
MKKVLLIDDDPVFALVAEKASKDYGIEIEYVSSFKKFKIHKLDGYDGFMVDYDLGDATGDEVLAFLSAKKIDRPVAMISATNHVDDAEPLVDARSYTFISKWLDTESFFLELKKVL